MPLWIVSHLHTFTHMQIIRNTHMHTHLKTNSSMHAHACTHTFTCTTSCLLDSPPLNYIPIWPLKPPTDFYPLSFNHFFLIPSVPFSDEGLIPEMLSLFVFFLLHVKTCPSVLSFSFCLLYFQYVYSIFF